MSFKSDLWLTLRWLPSVWDDSFIDANSSLPFTISWVVFLSFFYYFSATCIKSDFFYLFLSPRAEVSICSVFLGWKIWRLLPLESKFSPWISSVMRQLYISWGPGFELLRFIYSDTFDWETRFLCESNLLLLLSEITSSCRDTSADIADLLFRSLRFRSFLFFIAFLIGSVVKLSIFGSMGAYFGSWPAVSEPIR